MHRVAWYCSRFALCALLFLVIDNCIAEATDPVRAIQQRLRDLGFYGGQTNGQIDANTRAAISEYESKAGLPVTGEATGALAFALSRPCRISMNEQNEVVRQGGCPKNIALDSAIQYKLLELGYLISGGTRVTAAEMQQAIREYERTVGLPSTGEVTNELLANLLSPCVVRVESGSSGSSGRPRGGCKKPTRSPFGEMIELK